MKVKIKLWKTGYEGEAQEHAFCHIERINVDHANYLTVMTNCTCAFKALIKYGQYEMLWQYKGTLYDHMEMSITY